MVRPMLGPALLVILAACGTAPGPAPAVVAHYPPDGYHGFRRGEAIVVTFSEPMDAASTEAAFQLLGPAGAPVPVEFDWEDGGRRLRARPRDPVAYSPDTSYLNYRYLLSTGARSRAGARLAAGLDVTFSTLRTFGLVRGSVAALDGAVSDLGYVYNDPDGHTACTPVLTGDTLGNRAVRSFFAFDLSGLDFGADAVASARVILYADRIDGAPFGPGGLGRLVPEQVVYLEDGALAADDYDRPASGALEPLESWPADALVLEVSDWLREALDGGASHLQLRLRFERGSDGDGAVDGVYIPTAEDDRGLAPRLEVGYYAP